MGGPGLWRNHVPVLNRPRVLPKLKITLTEKEKITLIMDDEEEREKDPVWSLITTVFM
jgi:hypothetical protein